MMPNMMPGIMMPGFALLWMAIGILLCLALVAALVWLFVRWLNHQKAPTMQPQDSYQMYEQGYRPQQRTPETYQEGGLQYPQAQYEQPQAQYPQEMPLQQ